MEELEVEALAALELLEENRYDRVSPDRLPELQRLILEVRALQCADRVDQALWRDTLRQLREFFNR